MEEKRFERVSFLCSGLALATVAVAESSQSAWVRTRWSSIAEGVGLTCGRLRRSSVVSRKPLSSATESYLFIRSALAILRRSPCPLHPGRLR